ncbi:hypothetical protein D7X25_28195 [bacterium 1XD42-8]|nr:hypothetical protein [Lachnospiraceae bacterium]RKJ41562.1 hypothetical protein D7X25_28195 [bacterium 1XD42-8]
MSIFLAFMIGIAVNLDNALIGMSLGVRGQKITIRSNVLISLTTGICALASTYGARMVTGRFMAYVNIIGAVFMISFGVFCFGKDFFSKESKEDMEEKFMNMEGKEVFFLGLLLAVNCIPPAFSAGIVGISSFLVGFFSAFFSYISLYFGNRMGKRLVKYSLVRFLSPISSVFLVVIGVLELFV